MTRFVNSLIFYDESGQYATWVRAPLNPFRGKVTDLQILVMVFVSIGVLISGVVRVSTILHPQVSSLNNLGLAFFEVIRKCCARSVYDCLGRTILSDAPEPSIPSRLETVQCG